MPVHRHAGAGLPQLLQDFWATIPVIDTRMLVGEGRENGACSALLLARLRQPATLTVLFSELTHRDWDVRDLALASPEIMFLGEEGQDS